MSTFTFRPPTLLHRTHDELELELDRHLPRLYDAHNALAGIAIQAPALNAGFAMVTGSLTVTGSKTGIVTGLATVTRVVVSIASATATNFTVTAQPTPATAGSINIYVWQPTAAGDTTPIACTTAVTIHWWASGTNTLKPT